MSTDQMSSTKAAWSIGIGTTAAVFLVMAGVFQALQGLAAVLRGQYFVVGPDYVYSIDASTWGWIHLVLGVIAVVTGVGVGSAATWARVVGMIIAGLGAISNFLWLPYQPWWAILMIVIYLGVIWALANLGRAADQS